MSVICVVTAFGHQTLLENHKVNHAALRFKPFKCDHCNDRFKTKQGTSEHIIALHTVGPAHKFTCKICEKQFLSQTEFGLHRFTHLNKLPPTCDTCGKSFRAPYLLAEHKRIHTGEHKPFTCKFCQKSFLRKTNIMQHLKIHEKKMKNQLSDAKTM